jgi:hypothetical protein
MISAIASGWNVIVRKKTLDGRACIHYRSEGSAAAQYARMSDRASAWASFCVGRLKP